MEDHDFYNNSNFSPFSQRSRGEKRYLIPVTDKEHQRYYWNLATKATKVRIQILYSSLPVA